MKLRLTCREVAHQLLRQREQPWAWHERLALRMHWWVCEGCRHFKGQVQTMDQALKTWRHYRDSDEA